MLYTNGKPVLCDWQETWEGCECVYVWGWGFVGGGGVQGIFQK